MNSLKIFERYIKIIFSHFNFKQIDLNELFIVKTIQKFQYVPTRRIKKTFKRLLMI